MIGLPLWVKYQERAYLYYLLSPPCKRDSSFEILLEGMNCKIYMDASENWLERTDTRTAPNDPELIRLIGKAVIAHLHIKKLHYN
jgi:hypothetical protein